MGTLPDAKHKGCLSLTEHRLLVWFSLTHYLSSLIFRVLILAGQPRILGPGLSLSSLSASIFPKYVMGVITPPLPIALG